MSVQWIGHGRRLDIEASVALEQGWRQLVQARSPQQLDSAIVYNLRLWRTLRDLALAHPVLNVGESLEETADHVATMLVLDASPNPDPRDVAFVAGRDLAVANDLLPPPVRARARDGMISEWSASDGGRFEEWLLDRLAGPRDAPRPRPFGRDA